MEERRRGALAHVVAVSMGYGHERAAHALRALTADGIILANDYPGIPLRDKKLWSTGQTWYERISRFKKVPLVGEAAFRVMDEIQAIAPFYPRRDLSYPSVQVKQTFALLRRYSWCKHLIDELAKYPKPLVSTYMVPAFAAEEFGYPDDIYIVLCDADISRAWVSDNPKKSRIKYFAPNGRVVERLKLYGVPARNIFFTGFPLPTEAVGGVDAFQALSDLSRRICVLDPQSVFTQHSVNFLETTFGQAFCRTPVRKPLSLTFAVGGAGAQRETAATMVQSLSKKISRGQLTLNLVAGTRPEVAQFFRDTIVSAHLQSAEKRGNIKLLYSDTRAKYFASFEKLMRTTDILWTKPSELSFYTGLGLPIIMADPVGSQETFNREWLKQVGGGADALDVRYTNEWLFDWIESGALARMAWNGFVNAPTHGAYRIEEILRGGKGSIHALPLVV